MATEVRDHKKMLAKDRKEAEKRVGPGSVVFDLVVPSYPVHLTLAQLITPLHPRPRTVCTVQLRRVLHRCTLALAPCAPYSCNVYSTVAPSPSHRVYTTVAPFIGLLHSRPRTVCPYTCAVYQTDAPLRVAPWHPRTPSRGTSTCAGFYTVAPLHSSRTRGGRAEAVARLRWGPAVVGSERRPIHRGPSFRVLNAIL